jgi:dihydrofolate synthase/folylpolyglutamate synthase
MHAPLLTVGPLRVLEMALDGLTVEVPAIGPTRLGLTGRHQAANAAVALGVIDALAAADIAGVGGDAIRRGLAAARWPGRLEAIVIDGVTAILDGAHNPDGAAALVGALTELRPSLPEGRATLLLGILADKEVDDMLALLASAPTLRNAMLVATDVPDARRTLAASALSERWSSIETTTGRAEPIANAEEALGHALDLARRAGGPLIVAGSLYLVGHVRALLLGESPRPDDERPLA